ncbi:hypothetical protein ScalyP_jg3299 [Parmales sp. scaly parma]|nr:hypothetical protein ScalyP_jg3299 [Parmales sp. scaly parma]
MGTGSLSKKPNSRSKIKKYKRASWTKNRKMDINQIQETIENAEKNGKPEPFKFEYDDELPGGGQFYCVPTSTHFTDAKALSDHMKTRFYKKRLKEIKEEKYDQDAAEAAGGMTKEVLPMLNNNKKK